ncbi:MAG TPA: hypothetical protein DEB39_09535 [Planctomycetaceae bacterium]|nr:hypothetical protein [Planctomycetaceae bacterium]
MAASIEDFVSRLVRTNKKFTFVFTEDFFNVFGKEGLLANRYKDIRRAIKYIDHHKGENAEMRASDPNKLFDVEVVVIRRNYTCFTTTFKELATGPFGGGALVPGFGQEIIDSEKAKLLVLAYFAEKEEEASLSITKMINERRTRQLVLVVESPADLKRPSLEPIRNLRHRLRTILISPTKGPIVDCQVGSIFQEGNSSSFASLMNHFCVAY